MCSHDGVPRYHIGTTLFLKVGKRFLLLLQMLSMVDQFGSSQRTGVYCLSVCSVSRPTNILSCSLFMSKTKCDSCLSGPFRNILACLQQSVDCPEFTVHIICPWWYFCVYCHYGYTYCILDSGPMNPSQATSLASLSAISLPGTLKYPGTHISLTLLNNDRHWSSMIVGGSI